MLRSITPCLLFIALLWPTAPAAAAESVLSRISKQEHLGATRLAIDLSASAPHRIRTSGQRIDLYLAGVEADPERLPRLPENGSIIRILLARLPQELMISFVLRSPPKSVKVSTRARPATIWLDMAWDESGERILPGIVVPVGGLPRLGRNSESYRLAGGSPYSGQWETFFRRHETPAMIAVPLRHAPPQLPPAGRQEVLSGAGLVGESESRWAEILPRLREALAQAPAGRQAEGALLLYAEALARAGRFTEAGAELRRFLTEYPASPERARGRYLLAWTLAGAGEPYQARVELGRLAGEAGHRLYAELSCLLQGEIELTLTRPAAALQEVERLPRRGELAVWRALRRGDALTELGRSREALLSYRQGRIPSHLWREHPFSLLRHARALEQTGAFGPAAERFREAAGLLPPGEEAALARFAEAACRLRAGEKETALTQLLELARMSPETEGGLRARMKVADLAVSEGIKTPHDPMSTFGHAARHAPRRALREEAFLKQAILHSLAGHTGESVEQLRTFLRRFGGGDLRRPAEALLLELLPRRIEELIAGGEELSALVLVEQHRELLLSGKMPADFLFHLGEVFERVGLLDRAVKVYAFIADGFAGRPEAARAFLPLTRVRLHHHDFSGAAGAADDYLTRFPAGKDRNEIFALLLEALMATGRLDEAAKKLTDPRRPGDPRIENLAGRIFWHLEELERAQAALARAGGEEGEPDFPLALRAEALYRQGRADQALPLYRELAAGGPFADQALFRCAQIRLAQGERGKALNLLRRLAEKEGESPWRKAGAEFLQLQEISEAGRNE